MLANWVGALGVQEFKRVIFHRSAWAQPHSAESAIDLLTWDVVGEILAATDPAPDVIVCKRGEMLPYQVPRDREQLEAYMLDGIGIAMRHTERCHPALAALAANFRQQLDSDVQVQVFATPRRTHGFGWHYDAEHVFIAQTAGIKDYYFRENTVEPTGRFPPTDFLTFHNETSPTQTACLVAGDFLYLPARWWHMAKAREDSLSISVGVMPPKTA